MKCTDISEISPLYLAGELDSQRFAQFRGHLQECKACACAIENLAAMDRALREAVLADEIDTTSVDHRIRQCVGADSKPPHRLRWIATAAALAIVVLLAGLGIRALMAPRGSGLYSDAADDHRAEVMDRKTRRWVSDQPGIQALARRAGVAAPVLAGLAPASYHLERAKLCRLDGRVFLHLVYSNGSRETSVFVRQRDEKQALAPAVESYTAFVQDESLAAIKTSRMIAVFVTAGRDPAASELAHFATQAL